MHRIGFIPLVALALTSCTVSSDPVVLEEAPSASQERGGGGSAARRQQLRDKLADAGVTPLQPPPTPTAAMFALGQALAFDPILSGNQDIACLTCHVPGLHTDDNRSLPLGTGGTGLGVARTGGNVIPRNAPELFNRHNFDGMFWDSRVRIDEQGRFVTPAGNQFSPDMEAILHAGSGALGAQSMFPVTSRGEMRGQLGESELGDIPDGQFRAIWSGLMARLGAIPQYRTMFEAAYPGTDFDDMSFAHAGNAIGHFEAEAFQSLGSPLQQFLNGDDGALSSRQVKGGIAFFDAGCGSCHGGPMLSDGEHHNTGVAQLGPGTRGGPTNQDDFGEVLVSGYAKDRFAFRTPSLHNVALTGPWGHAGQFNDLETYNEHYIDPEQALLDYVIADNVDNPDLWSTQHDNLGLVLDNLSPIVSGGVPSNLIDNKLADFLENGLTDPGALDLSHTVPLSVPSGLPVLGN